MYDAENGVWAIVSKSLYDDKVFFGYTIGELKGLRDREGIRFAE